MDRQATLDNLDPDAPIETGERPCKSRLAAIERHACHAVLNDVSAWDARELADLVTAAADAGCIGRGQANALRATCAGAPADREGLRAFIDRMEAAFG